jgi:hypothetical protein
MSRSFKLGFPILRTSSRSQDVVKSSYVVVFIVVVETFHTHCENW